MSQLFAEEQMDYSTGNDNIEFSLQIDVEVITQSTEVTSSETQVFSLELPENEPLENAERDMDLLAKNSFKDS